MFTQPCFIRKNTSELRKKLEDLGYKFLGYGHEYHCLCTDTRILTENGYGAFYECNMGDFPPLYEGKINCGKNEELFLSIAALRNDSDIFQYFTNGNIVITCELDSMNEFLKIFYDGFIKNDEDLINHINNWHKLTVEELIKHFK